MLRVSADVPFKYNSVERNCIEVPANDDQYDGCQPELTSVSENFVKSFIEEYADIGNIDFTGEACYYDELTSSGSLIKSSVTVLCATLLSLLHQLLQ